MRCEDNRRSALQTNPIGLSPRLRSSRWPAASTAGSLTLRLSERTLELVVASDGGRAAYAPPQAYSHQSGTGLKPLGERSRHSLHYYCSDQSSFSNLSNRAAENVKRRHSGARALPASPESQYTCARSQLVGRCSWIPGPALKSRPGTTASFSATC
jgi:hypothetical protein